MEVDCPVRSARQIPSPRTIYATQKRRASSVSIMTSPSENLTTSSRDAQVTKKGVTNMGFKCDEGDECTTPDSGIYDVCTPVTSPVNDEEGMLHHKAVNKRKSLADLMNFYYPTFTLAAPPSEVQPLVTHVPGVAPKIDYGSRADRSDNYHHFEHAITPVGSQSCLLVKPSSNDVIKSGQKQSKISMEINALRALTTKPRALSQPLRKARSKRYETLESVSEEEFENSEANRKYWTSDRQEREDHVSERLTIYPGYQNQSGISLNVWQVKLGDKQPEKCRCDNAAQPSKKDAQPRPPPREPSESEITYVTGCQISVGGSVPMTASDAPSEVEGIVTTFGTSREMSDIVESPYTATAASMANSGSDSIGDTATSMDMPPPSAGKRRRSIKTIFRLGFLTTKSKKKGKTEESIPSPDAGPPPETSKRLVQRRISRLEMNEPIEDIFSEVKFETMQKRASTSNDVTNGDDDVSDDEVIEDPEAILRSIMSNNEGENDEDDLVFGDSTKLVSNNDCDVTEPKISEKDLLLPEADRSRPSLGTVSEEIVTSENDLR